VTSVETVRVVVSEPVPATFGHHDYADAFTVVRRPDDHRDAEQWARDCLDGAPRAFTAVVPILWRRVVGFRMGPRPSPEHVLGWQVIGTTPETIELRTHGWQASAGVVIRVRERTVRFTTYFRYERRFPGRITWFVLGPVHRFFVPRLLRWASP
jgi:hypothetical protein